MEKTSITTKNKWKPGWKSMNNINLRTDDIDDIQEFNENERVIQIFQVGCIFNINTFSNKLNNNQYMVIRKYHDIIDDKKLITHCSVIPFDPDNNNSSKLFNSMEIMNVINIDCSTIKNDRRAIQVFSNLTMELLKDRSHLKTINEKLLNHSKSCNHLIRQLTHENRKLKESLNNKQTENNEVSFWGFGFGEFGIGFGGFRRSTTSKLGVPTGEDEYHDFTPKRIKNVNNNNNKNIDTPSTPLRAFGGLIDESVVIENEDEKTNNLSNNNNSNNNHEFGEITDGLGFLNNDHNKNMNNHDSWEYNHALWEYNNNNNCASYYNNRNHLSGSKSGNANGFNWHQHLQNMEMDKQKYAPQRGSLKYKQNKNVW